MRCRQCGTEIAEKALICYRCGTATTEPTYKPASIRRRSSVGLLTGVLAVVLLVLLALCLDFQRIGSPLPLRAATWVATTGVLILTIRMYLRRR